MQSLLASTRTSCSPCSMTLRSPASSSARSATLTRSMEAGLAFGAAHHVRWSQVLDGHTCLGERARYDLGAVDPEDQHRLGVARVAVAMHLVGLDVGAVVLRKRSDD